jgi:CrcB protein
MAAGDLHVLAAISVGGGLGSIARYGVAAFDPADGNQLPGATLAINLTGSLLLGVLIGALSGLAAREISTSPLLRPFLGTGILGGYTTFSTFAVQSHELSLPTSVAYIGLSVLLGIALAAGGLAMGAWLMGIRPTGAASASLDPDLP